MTQPPDHSGLTYEVNEDENSVSIWLPTGEERDVPLTVGEYRCNRHLLEGWPWKSGQIMYWEARSGGHYCRVHRDWAVFVVEHGWGDWQGTVKPGYHLVHERESFETPGEALSRAVQLMLDHTDRDIPSNDL